MGRTGGSPTARVNSSRSHSQSGLLGSYPAAARPVRVEDGLRLSDVAVWRFTNPCISQFEGELMKLLPSKRSDKVVFGHPLGYPKALSSSTSSSSLSSMVFAEKLVTCWELFGAILICCYNEGFFAAEFVTNEQRNMVLSKAPWRVENMLLYMALEPFPSSYQLGDPAPPVALWIQLHDVKEDFYTPEKVTEAATQLGRVADVQLHLKDLGLSSRVARVKIMFDLDDTMESLVVIRADNGESQQIRCRFEVKMLYTRCGRITHSDVSCPFRKLPDGSSNKELNLPGFFKKVKTSPLRVGSSKVLSSKTLEKLLAFKAKKVSKISNILNNKGPVKGMSLEPYPMGAGVDSSREEGEVLRYEKQEKIRTQRKKGIEPLEEDQTDQSKDFFLSSLFDEPLKNNKLSSKVKSSKPVEPNIQNRRASSISTIKEDELTNSAKTVHIYHMYFNNHNSGGGPRRNIEYGSGDDESRSTEPSRNRHKRRRSNSPTQVIPPNQMIHDQPLPTPIFNPFEAFKTYIASLLTMTVDPDGLLDQIKGEIESMILTRAGNTFLNNLLATLIQTPTTNQPLMESQVLPVSVKSPKFLTKP